MYCELFICLVELDAVGTRDRLDGNEWYQHGIGFHRTRSYMAKSMRFVIGLINKTLHYICVVSRTLVMVDCLLTQ